MSKNRTNIVDFNPSDGLTPLQIKKLNWNFKKLFDSLTNVDYEQQGAIKGIAVETHEVASGSPFTVIRRGTSSNIILSFGVPPSFDVRIVNSLPSIGEPNIVYLVRNTSVSGDSLYLEYVWKNGRYEKIGDSVDNVEPIADSYIDNLPL